MIVGLGHQHVAFDPSRARRIRRSGRADPGARPLVATARGALAALATCLLAVWSLPAAAQAPGQCVITRVDGAAVVSARGAGRLPAAVGVGLGTGAHIRTEAGARVTLSCADGLRVVIGPETELSVAGILGDAQGPLGLRLLDGIAGFLFDTGGERGIQVRTPSAVAAVRSTEWAMQVEERASAVFARDGTVFVFGEDDSVRLGPGDGVDVSGSGETGAVARWGQARIDRFDALLGPDW